MKKILLVILFLLLFPSMVLAKDTCNSNDIKIEEIRVEEKEGYTEEVTPVSIDNNKINLNLEMYNVGESITYKIKIKNNSNNDYYFTKDSFNLNTDYIEYSLLNDSEVIKSNEEKEIQLKITYKNKIPEDEFNENNMMNITLSDTPLNNPSTKRSLILILLIVGATTILIFVGEKKLIEKFMIGIVALLAVPLIAHALCTVTLEINSNIIINSKEAIFLPGREVNTKMKQLAGDDTSTSVQPHYFRDENITAIIHSNAEPIDSNKEEKNIVSTIDSPYPIYMWYEEGTIYWWSDDKTPNINEDASYMFNLITKLDNIAEISSFDSSNVLNMAYMFNNTNLTDLVTLEKWNTSQVTNMNSLFSNILSLTTLEGLKRWNTSNVTDLSWTFKNTSISSLKGLEDWDVSSVTTMLATFQDNPNLTSVEELANWDTSNVTSLVQTFCGTSLENLHGLEKWNTSKVTNLMNTFAKISTLASVKELIDWDTSNVTTMSYVFAYTNLINLEGLENWDTSNVNIFIQMFCDIQNLTDASAINDWNIPRTASFSQMFRFTPVHPEFTKVTGTWNSTGTFIPS